MRKKGSPRARAVEPQRRLPAFRRLFQDDDTGDNGDDESEVPAVFPMSPLMKSLDALLKTPPRTPDRETALLRQVSLLFV